MIDASELLCSLCLPCLRLRFYWFLRLLAVLLRVGGNEPLRSPVRFSPLDLDEVADLERSGLLRMVAGSTVFTHAPRIRSLSAFVL